MAVSRGGALRIEQCEPVTMRIEGTLTHTRSAGRRCCGCEELTLLACDCHSPRSPLHRDRAEAPIIRMVDPRASSFPADRFENRPPPGLYRYRGPHLAVSGGPPTPPVRWARCHTEKHPPAGPAGGCVFRK